MVTFAGYRSYLRTETWHQKFGTHLGISNSGKKWEDFEKTAWTMIPDCNPRPRDVATAIRRLRLDSKVLVAWLRINNDPDLAKIEAAVRRAGGHKVMHMFDCGLNLDNPLDWLLHVPTLLDRTELYDSHAITYEGLVALNEQNLDLIKKIGILPSRTCDPDITFPQSYLEKAVSAVMGYMSTAKDPG